MKIFFRFYKLFLSLQKDKKLIRFLSFIFSIVLVILDSYVIMIIGGMIDQVSTGQVQLTEKLWQMIFYLSIPFIVEPMTFYLKSIALVTALRRMTKIVYDKLINQDYKFHIDKQTGKLITKIFKTSELIFLFTWDLEYFLLSNILAFFIPLIFIAMISKELALVAFIAFFLSIPLLYVAIKINIKYRTLSKDAEYERNSVITDGIGNFVTVRAFGKEKREIEVLDEKLIEYSDAEFKYQLTWRFVDFVSRLGGLIIFGSVSYFVAHLYETGAITLGEVVIVLTYMIMFMGKVIGLFFSLRNIMKDIPYMKDTLEIIESKPTIADSVKPKLLSHLTGQIILDNVYFNYTNKTQVIEGISLEIKPNQTVAFVGPSGGGKTTLTKLIMRYYDPTSGRILIDGIDIKKLSYSSLRSLIGLVPQEPVLFNRSIYYNVAYAFDEDFQNKEKNFDLVLEACKKAQIHDFIESLPEGYDTMVGERGLKLSGGQKQRIAIAQIIIKNPKIVIFDEATSQLDSESEKAIQQAFSELSKDKTTIIIAHRLSTITHADNIFVIDQGKVKETGTHNELLEIKNGIYAGLWNIQSGGFKKRVESKE